MANARCEDVARVAWHGPQEGVATVVNSHAIELKRRQRFEFGENWTRFLTLLDDDRIETATESLRTMLEVKDLRGRRFLDAGCGSGLFSLAARRLGARVHSFDYDPKSVACTAELKRRYYPGDEEWTVEEGSVLEREYLGKLGHFDVVYSWGVLHHTGAMWDAIRNVSELTAKGGKLFIAIYNDQGGRSRRWRWVKRKYNQLPSSLRFLLVIPAAIFNWTPLVLSGLLRGKPLEAFAGYKKNRGMSPYRDLLDWVGGYPFEVAKPEEIFDFHHQRGFELVRMKTRGAGLGCNEFVFTKRD